MTSYDSPHIFAPMAVYSDFIVIYLKIGRSQHTLKATTNPVTYATHNIFFVPWNFYTAAAHSTKFIFNLDQINFQNLWRISTWGWKIFVLIHIKGYLVHVAIEGEKQLFRDSLAEKKELTYLGHTVQFLKLGSHIVKVMFTDWLSTPVQNLAEVDGFVDLLM